MHVPRLRLLLLLLLLTGPRMQMTMSSKANTFWFRRLSDPTSAALL
jgi:hypothetical protein